MHIFYKHKISTYFTSIKKTLNICVCMLSGLIFRPLFFQICDHHQKDTLFFPILDVFAPKRCTHVHWLVLKTFLILCIVLFYKDDIHFEIQVLPPPPPPTLGLEFVCTLWLKPIRTFSTYILMIILAERVTYLHSFHIHVSGMNDPISGYNYVEIYKRLTLN